MRFPCNVVRLADASWLARHQGPAAGQVEARGTSRDEALEKLVNEIRYRLELCPCTGETYQHIQVDVVEVNS